METSGTDMARSFINFPLTSVGPTAAPHSGVCQQGHGVFQVPSQGRYYLPRSPARCQCSGKRSAFSEPKLARFLDYPGKRGFAMNIRILIGLVAGSAGLLTAGPGLLRAQMPTEYQEVLTYLGRTGDFKADVLKVNIPRNDLKMS